MIYSEYQAALDRIVTKAHRLAASTGETQFVCEIDDGGEFGERSLIICNRLYLDDPEFEAFDGRVIQDVDAWGDGEGDPE